MEKCCCGKPATKLFKRQPHCDDCTEMLEQMWRRNRATGEAPLIEPIEIPPTPANTFRFWETEI